MIVKKAVLIFQSCFIAGIATYFLLVKNGDINILKIVASTSIVVFSYLVLSAVAIYVCSSMRSWAYKFHIATWNSDVKLTYAIVWPFVILPLFFWYLVIGIINRIF